MQKPYPQLLFGGSGNRMRKLAGKYVCMCFIPPFSQTHDFYETSKSIVLKAAEVAKRKEKKEFMPGFMCLREPFSIERSFERIEAAITTGASYFLTSFPQTDNFHNLMKAFAKEVMPFFQ